MFALTDRKTNPHSRWSSGSSNPDPVSDSAGSVATLTVIGKAMVIRGRITSRESLHVDGQVDGTLDLPESRLTIGPNGRVGADAHAREIEVLGTVTGDLEARKKSPYAREAA